jgi:hypothetical protein
MAGLAGVQVAIDKGRGAAAAKIGQSYSVYRLNSSSTGQLAQPSNLVYSDFRMSPMRWTNHEDTEVNMIVKVPYFRGFFQGAQLQLGDLLVENPKSATNGATIRSDQGAFTFAYSRPLRQFIFVATPLPITLTRSEDNPAALTSGRAPYMGMNKGTEQTLALINGQYSFKTAGLYPQAVIYVGLQGNARGGEVPRPDLRLPTEVKRQEWFAYHWELPGCQLVESDIINAANGDRYYIRFPFVQYVGFQGWQHICEKLRV